MTDITVECELEQVKVRRLFSLRGKTTSELLKHLRRQHKPEDKETEQRRKEVTEANDPTRSRREEIYTTPGAPGRKHTEKHPPE